MRVLNDWFILTDRSPKINDLKSIIEAFLSSVKSEWYQFYYFGVKLQDTSFIMK